MQIFLQSFLLALLKLTLIKPLLKNKIENSFVIADSKAVILVWLCPVDEQGFIHPTNYASVKIYITWLI